MLTGVKDLDFKILNELPDQDLVNVCKTNKQANKLCDDQNFWLQRIMIKFSYLDLNVLKRYKQGRSWSQYYIEDLRTINKENAIYKLEEGSENGRLDQVVISMNKGADIHANDSLIPASENGYIQIVKYLVENGADIHARDDESLRGASLYGHLDVVKYLVEQGADIHVFNDYSLRYSSRFGHLDVVKYLASKGANIHANNDYSLRWASRNRYLDVVDYLVSRGATL